MKIQTRLSVCNSIVFGVIFAAVLSLTYIVYYRHTERLIYSNLEKTVYITALFYMEEDELNREEFLKVRTQFNEFVNNSLYQIYDQNDSLCYGSNYLRVSPKYINEIRLKKHLSFSDNGFLCHGIFYEDNQGDFVVVSREKSDSIDQQFDLLLWILLLSWLIGTLVIIILNKWISNIAYRPFRRVIRQVKNISTHNLEVQIASPQTADELQDLIETFNDLLAKISETFVIQRNFVSYVSHEFKTPLAAMMGNLEVFSIKDRQPEEYKLLSGKLIQQISQLEEILNTLIIVSDMRNNSDVTTQIRIDEILWEIISKVSNIYPTSDISVHMDIRPEDQYILSITKDRTQILIALFNLIENAVKFSQGKSVTIHLFNKENRLCVSIKDEGIGIPPEKLENINKPFYRADNANHILGSGIGLSIALRILEKNSIKYTIESIINKGTIIVIRF